VLTFLEGWSPRSPETNRPLVRVEHDEAASHLVSGCCDGLPPLLMSLAFVLQDNLSATIRTTQKSITNQLSPNSMVFIFEAQTAEVQPQAAQTQNAHSLLLENDILKAQIVGEY